MAMRCSSDISSSVMMQGIFSSPAETAAWTRWLPDSTSYLPSAGSRAAIDPANAYYMQPYEINYGAPLGQWTLKEGLALWKKKHSQKR